MQFLYLTKILPDLKRLQRQPEHQQQHPWEPVRGWLHGDGQHEANDVVLFVDDGQHQQRQQQLHRRHGHRPELVPHDADVAKVDHDRQHVCKW